MARIWGRFAAIMLAWALFATLSWDGYGVAAAQEEAAADGNQGAGKVTRNKGSFGTQLAAGELARIDQQIESQRQSLDMVAQQVKMARELEPVRAQLAILRGQAGNICAADEPARRKFHGELEALFARLQEPGYIEVIGQWVAPTFAEMCTQSAPDSLLRDLDLATNFANAPTQQAQAEKDLAELEERREEVLGEMTKDLAGTSVAEKIPLLLLIIFGVGAGTLAGVKLFRDDVQRELVASGQIVQFVTILILLGVILSLGLAQRLQAETLGTLLGGLAGYVLSQGVGRQAQQQVLNEIKSVAASAPPPPPPPPPPVEPGSETRPA